MFYLKGTLPGNYYLLNLLNKMFKGNGCAVAPFLIIISKEQ